LKPAPPNSSATSVAMAGDEKGENCAASGFTSIDERNLLEALPPIVNYAIDGTVISVRAGGPAAEWSGDAGTSWAFSRRRIS
jgi:hypothetical protein